MSDRAIPTLVGDVLILHNDRLPMPAALGIISENGQQHFETDLSVEHGLKEAVPVGRTLAIPDRRISVMNTEHGRLDRTAARHGAALDRVPPTMNKRPEYFLPGADRSTEL